MKEKRIQSRKAGWMTCLCALALGLVFVVAVVTTSAAQSAKPRYGGTLRVSDYTEGQSIGYPPKQLPVVSQRQGAPAVESLFRTDQTGQPAPWLAVGEKSDVKARTVTISLRKGIKFHDGTDFNAEAVKWNLEQYMAAKSSGTENFKSIDVVDNSTVRINLSAWDNSVTGNLDYSIGQIVSPTAAKKNGTDWAASHPVGTGPFEFVSWEKDVRTVYRRFPGYWQKGKPYVDRIESTPINDSLTRQLSFRNGELDVILTIAPKDVAALEKEGYVVARRYVGSGVYSVVPDSANPKSPFADLKVRQAAQHAVDTAAIAKTIFYGYSEPANQWIYKGHWAYNPSIVGYPYNPAKAKQLLAEAGYPNGFKTKLLYIQSPENTQLYTAFQGYLSAVGINVELEPVSMIKWTEIATQGGKWEGFIHGSVVGTLNVAGALALRYSGGKNYTQMLVPDDYLKAINSAINAPDLKTRQKWTQEAMKLMIDKYCLRTVFCARPDFAVSQRYVKNHGYLGTPSTSWWTPEDVWLEK